MDWAAFYLQVTLLEPTTFQIGMAKGERKMCQKGLLQIHSEGKLVVE